MPTGLMKNELKLVSKPQHEIILTILTKDFHHLSPVETGFTPCFNNLVRNALAVVVQIDIFIQWPRIFESVLFPKKGKSSLEKML